MLIVRSGTRRTSLCLWFSSQPEDIVGGVILTNQTGTADGCSPLCQTSLVKVSYCHPMDPAHHSKKWVANLSITVIYSTFINPGAAGPFAYVIPTDKPLVKPSMCPTGFIEKEKKRNYLWDQIPKYPKTYHLISFKYMYVYIIKCLIGVALTHEAISCHVQGGNGVW